MSERGATEPPDNLDHTTDQGPQTQEDPSPPVIPDNNKEENETVQDQDKAQLSSSVIIDVPNVQSSLELSTITGV